MATSSTTLVIKLGANQDLSWMEFYGHQESLLFYVRWEHPIQERAQHHQCPLRLEGWNQMASSPHGEECESPRVLLNIASHLLLRCPWTPWGGHREAKVLDGIPRPRKRAHSIKITTEYPNRKLAFDQPFDGWQHRHWRIFPVQVCAPCPLGHSSVERHLHRWVIEVGMSRIITAWIISS